MEVKINKYVTLIVDDCVKSMKLLKDNSVDLIVTSPPYWGQRDYKNANQWGNEKDVKEYITKMTVWGKECFRVLRNTGSLFLNIGDKYSKNCKSLLLSTNNNVIPSPPLFKIFSTGKNSCLSSNKMCTYIVILDILLK